MHNDLEWPDPEEVELSEEAKDLISSLLQKNPASRLGTPPVVTSPYEIVMAGAEYVKDHDFFLMEIEVWLAHILVLY